MAKNPLEVSDEEFLEMEVPEVDEETTDSEGIDNKEEIEETEQKEESNDLEDNTSESNEEPEDEELEEESDEPSNTDEDDDQSNQQDEEQDNTSNDDSEDDSINDNEDTDTKDTDTSIDYKSEYQKLLSPFKANGKDMSIANVDDARTLMMMGANYNKKMAGLKPYLKVVKTLENNELLDEDKINYLIDLSKKNPDAIKKLVQDSELDPMDIDTDEESTYKPDNYAVSDKEIELDTVLDDIRQSPKFQDTIEVISNQWDAGSKQIILDNPSVIKIINEHMEAGIYEQISSVVESERVLGRLNGLSDIEAYKQIGDAIHERGGFTQPNTMNQQPNTNNSNQQTKIDPKLAAKKKAASSTKSTSSKTKKKSDFNPLNMSDEEFEKMSIDKFL